MNASAISFHLVDRIAELDLDAGARGTLEIPSDASSFPACLLVEAIGQLAAWVAMRRTDFARRPVAALAGGVRVLGAAIPGRRIDLEVVIKSCKQVAIAYEGVARLDGAPLVELVDAAGAMVPMDEFESAEEARARFEQLIDVGLPPRRFPDPQRFAARVVSRDLDPGRRLAAVLEVEPDGALYADHFPRRPVYPATLLLDAQLRLAFELADPVGHPSGRAASADDLVGTLVRNVKVRRFTPPGSRVALVAEVLGDSRGSVEEPIEVSMIATADDRRASSATVLVPRTSRL